MLMIQSLRVPSLKLSTFLLLALLAYDVFWVGLTHAYMERVTLFCRDFSVGILFLLNFQSKRDGGRRYKESREPSMTGNACTHH